jgi:hypothetical protein
MVNIFIASTKSAASSRDLRQISCVNPRREARLFRGWLRVMSMHLPSAITKWLNIVGAAAIVVSSLVLVGWGIAETERRGRCERFQALAEQHAWLSLKARGWSYTLTSNRQCIRGDWPTPLSLYHDRMKAKYECAARYPWLPVEPDPPKPEP